MKKQILDKIIEDHKKWLSGYKKGKRANLFRANLREADLSGANLSGADLCEADLCEADLSGADLSGVDLFKTDLRRANLSETNFHRAKLCGADLSGADLSGADLSGADLSGADLSGADLHKADLCKTNLYRTNFHRANLREADLSGADLHKADLCKTNLYRTNFHRANLREADLSGADLSGADLCGVKGLVKKMGVTHGNVYYKKFNNGLKNNNYQYRIGINKLRKNEKFNQDERILCGYPGFHFASESWCDFYYSERPLKALIKIPEEAKINEPWATDGKASADMIEIIQVWDVKTGEDVTDKYRNIDNYSGIE